MAPAGYGKSTLVASWLETCGCPSAWLSLDEDDNALPQFLSYLTAAIRTIFPDALQETRGLLQAASLPPLDVLARSLINELDQIERFFILVLDDYHAVQNMDIHHVLTELLRYPPRPLHLVLASRSAPPLPLPQLRARGRATEIRTQALRFTEAETAAFLKSVGMQVDDRTVRALVERAREGKSLPDDLSGGTFTITNLGMYDIDAFTPIINLPECAILGVGRIQLRAVPRGSEIVARQMITLSLTFDHRLVDGAPAARFLQRIKELIEDPYRVLG